MNCRVNKSVVVSVLIALVLFVIRTIMAISVDLNMTQEEITVAQTMVNLFCDYLITLFALVVSMRQAWENRKSNKFAFAISILAVVFCVIALFAEGAMVMWQQFGTYIALAFSLCGMAIIPKQNEQCNKEDIDSKKVVKIAALILAIIMLIIGICSFALGSPAFVISDGLIYVFVLVIVLLVWDSIESLSLANIVSLKKTVKEKEKEVTQLHTENRELRAQFLTVVQNRQSTSFNMSFGGTDAKVEPVTQDDSKEDRQNQFGCADVVVGTDPSEQMPESFRQRLSSRIESYAIEKFVTKNKIPASDLQREVKLSSQFIDSDPIMVQNVVFDAYAKRPLGDAFIEVSLPSFRPGYYERMYYMISKVQQYSISRRVDAKLILIVPQLPLKKVENYPERLNISRDPVRHVNLMRERFKPAIKNGFLEVALIEITDEEFEKLSANGE